MPTQAKEQKVAELQQRIEGAEALFLADFRGLTVGDVAELRASLRDAGTRFSVVKNTLMRRAVGAAGMGELDALLEGPTAVAFVEGDPVAAAKSLVDAIRRFRTMSLKGGFMEGRVLSQEQAQSIATIEPREVLLARVAGGAKSPMALAAYMFQALQSRFAALLEAYREKVPAPAAEEEPAASAEESQGDGGTPEEQEEQPTSEPPTEPREKSKPDPDQTESGREAEGEE